MQDHLRLIRHTNQCDDAWMSAEVKEDLRLKQCFGTHIQLKQQVSCHMTQSDQ